MTAEIEIEKSNSSNKTNIRVSNFCDVFLLIDTLNINSHPEIFDQLKLLINKAIDVLALTEKKLDYPFILVRIILKATRCHTD